MSMSCRCRFSLIRQLTRREKPETPETTAGQGRPLKHNLNTDQVFGVHDVLGHGGMQYAHYSPSRPAIITHSAARQHGLNCRTTVSYNASWYYLNSSECWIY